MKNKSDNKDSRNGPTFIGVGPEKTGTTWIDRQLRQHADVWLPPIKEMRYFWEKEHFPGESSLARLNIKGSWHREQYAARLKSLFRHPIGTVQAGRDQLFWDLRYIFLRHDDRWYLSCFQNHGEKISGEISPQYFFLPSSQISQIAQLLPHCKILITLRRPIDWVWSFAKMNTKSGFLQEEYGDLDAYIENKISNCSFSQAVTNWRDAYGDSQVLILFYENLCSDPWSYYERICEFLGIAPETAVRSTIADRVNRGSEDCLPDWCVEKIKEGWREDILALSHLVTDLPASWLD